MRAIWTVRPIKSPCGTPRGQRLIVALDNAERSFAPPYQLMIFGDLPSMGFRQIRKALQDCRNFYKITSFRRVRSAGTTSVASRHPFLRKSIADISAEIAAIHIPPNLFGDTP